MTNTNSGNNTFYPRTFYILYIGPHNNGIGQLILILSTKEILTIMKYQSVPVHENLFKTISETNSFANKIQINHSNSNHFTVQDNHYSNTKDDNEPQSNDMDNSEDDNYDELDNSQ